MKWASVPSAYRNCILRASVRTARNFSPARKVRSMTAPSAARRSFERTNAPPLPGLTCWNSRILKTVPSTSMWFPFLNWLVEITPAEASRARVDATAAGVAAARPLVVASSSGSDRDRGRRHDVGPRALHDRHDPVALG